MMKMKGEKSNQIEFGKFIGRVGNAEGSGAKSYNGNSINIEL